MTDDRGTPTAAEALTDEQIEGYRARLVGCDSLCDQARAYNALIAGAGEVPARPQRDTDLCTTWVNYADALLSTVRQQAADAAHVRQANANYREENRLAIERAEQAETRAEAVAKDASLWNMLVNLWEASTVMELRQDEEGTWSIRQIEAVDETFTPLIGDTPDTALAQSQAGQKGERG